MQFDLRRQDLHAILGLLKAWEPREWGRERQEKATRRSDRDSEAEVINYAGFCQIREADALPKSDVEPENGMRFRVGKSSSKHGIHRFQKWTKMGRSKERQELVQRGERFRQYFLPSPQGYSWGGSGS